MTPAPNATLAERLPIRPVDAASLILVDRRGVQPRFLMGRRHQGHAFMPGRMVFPGGRLEPADRTMRAFGALAGHTERNLLLRAPRATPAKARALALCAIRETAEETGILLGEAGLGAPPTASPAWAAFVEHGVYPSLEAMHFIARAVTPPGFPRRFDARFFAAEASAIGHRAEGVAGPDGELVELKWLTAEQTIAEPLADITRTILVELVARLEAGLERDLPVPFFARRRGHWGRQTL
jgi:8-oxo-dGTP pyrophosphatase MutT (NUDIX family)